MLLERTKNHSVYETALKNHSEIISDLLSRRISDIELIEKIVYPKQSNINDPYLLPDMNEGVKTIINAIEKELKIACVVDYDTDGISSGSVLHTGLIELGVKEENIYILVTDRHEDGYGFSKGTANKILNGHCGFIPEVIITADLGSSDGLNIDYFVNQMKEDFNKVLGKNLFFIVTDHHHISETTPPKNITAFISPQRKDSLYPDNKICGAYVAWNLIMATNLSISKRKAIGENFINSKNEDMFCLMDYVACATVGDMMDLKSENNRIAIKMGIDLFNSENRFAWRYIKSKINGSLFDEETIGFQISPRINALSRMGDSARLAFRFLTSTTDWDASNNWEQMDYNNELRKEEQKKATDIVVELSKKEENLLKSGLVFFVPKAEHGVVGLCANELVRLHGKPSIVLSQKENGEIVGSGRSISGIDIREILFEIQEEFECFSKYGGHTMACGLSMKPEKLDFFIDIFDKKVCEKAGKELKPIFKHDGFLKKEHLSLDTLKEIEILKPFGQGFEKPSFAVKGKILSYSPLGKSENPEHFKVVLSSSEGFEIECIWFKTNPNEWIKEESYFIIEMAKNIFRNEEKLQIRISIQEAIEY